MTTFRVTWEIDLDAETPWDAAKEAQAIMQDPDSSATIFTVSEAPHTSAVQLDLAEYDFET